MSHVLSVHADNRLEITRELLCDAKKLWNVPKQVLYRNVYNGQIKTTNVEFTKKTRVRIGGRGCCLSGCLCAKVFHVDDEDKSVTPTFAQKKFR